jgi:BirA family transcriptional regulator, biotin operon repressor / biotin---[acetyl-CoA-carboxylase] ligase
LKSIRSDSVGRCSDGGPYCDAIARARGRLGRLGSQVLYYPTIGSTNDAAAALVATGATSVADAEGVVVVADEQLSGRGRRGRSWFSPAGSGLYVSVVLTPGRSQLNPVRALQLLTLAAGVALAEGIGDAAGVNIELKWPNDLYVGRRKLGGILAEALTSGFAIPPVALGYGINVGAAAYPPDVADRATSLEVELGQAVDRERLFIETLAALARWYDELLAGRFDDILAAWRRRASSAIGRRVTWNDIVGERSGITSGIDDEGALLVNVGDRVERLVGGELSWDL